MRIPRWVDYVDLHTCTVVEDTCMVRCDEKQSNEPIPPRAASRTVAEPGGGSQLGSF